MNEVTKKDIETISDRVWITKKARMEAEARMNSNDFFSKLLVYYYTFVVLAFSIWALISEDSDISLLTVIGSVGLFGVSIFVNAIGYREKALQYKESYLSLTNLEFDIKNLHRRLDEEADCIAELNKHERRYSEILTKSENHSDIDYIKVLLKHAKKVKPGEVIKYYIHKIMYCLLVILFISIPILFALYIEGS